MSAFSIIRQLTDHDLFRVNESAKRFSDRHEIPLNFLRELQLSPYTKLEYQINALDNPKLTRLWQSCKCRALKVPISASVTISHGYIAHRAK
jgi:hypothetical protein